MVISVIRKGMRFVTLPDVFFNNFVLRLTSDAFFTFTLFRLNISLIIIIKHVKQFFIIFAFVNTAKLIS